jgi:hypothetical protein
VKFGHRRFGKPLAAKGVVGVEAVAIELVAATGDDRPAAETVDVGTFDLDRLGHGGRVPVVSRWELVVGHSSLGFSH